MRGGCRPIFGVYSLHALPFRRSIGRSVYRSVVQAEAGVARACAAVACQVSVFIVPLRCRSVGRSVYVFMDGVFGLRCTSWATSIVI